MKDRKIGQGEKRKHQHEKERKTIHKKNERNSKVIIRTDWEGNRKKKL